MRKTIVASALAVAAFAVGSEARAADFGLHTGEVLPGGFMIYSEVGFPDFSFGFQQSMTNRFDLGFRLSIDYGAEYRTNNLEMGLGMRVPLRLQLFESGKLSGLLKFEPGLKFDQFDNPVLFGVQFPIGFEMGLKMTRELTVQFGFDMPFYVNFTNPTYLGLPVLFGFGVEYLADRNMSIGLNTRYGPSVVAGNGGSSTAFGLIAQGFFAYHL